MVLNYILVGCPCHLFSDHLTGLTTVRSAKPAIISNERVYRKIKSIDLDTFRNDLAVSELCQETHKEFNELVECYNKTLTCVRFASNKNHSPKATCALVLATKRMRRKEEKKWRSSNSTQDLKEYKSARNFAYLLI